MELIIIFDEKDEVTVSIATQILEENGIPSIHISGGGKYPLKTGLRVKYDDYTEVKEILIEFGVIEESDLWNR